MYDVVVCHMELSPLHTPHYSGPLRREERQQSIYSARNAVQQETYKREMC